MKVIHTSIYSFLSGLNRSLTATSYSIVLPEISSVIYPIVRQFVPTSLLYLDANITIRKSFELIIIELQEQPAA